MMIRDDLKKMIEENRVQVTAETTRWDVINHSKHSTVHSREGQGGLTFTDFVVK